MTTSIHGTLAALLGGTALGGYAPLKAGTLAHHWAIGLNSGKIAPRTITLHQLTGLNPLQLSMQNVAHHIPLCFAGLSAVNMMAHMILGLQGLFLNMFTRHALVVIDDFAGYGTRYGGSYGG